MDIRLRMAGCRTFRTGSLALDTPHSLQDPMSFFLLRSVIHVLASTLAGDENPAPNPDSTTRLGWSARISERGPELGRRGSKVAHGQRRKNIPRSGLPCRHSDLNHVPAAEATH